MDKTSQTQPSSKPQHRPKAVENAAGGGQGASPNSYTMADGTAVMRLDDINSFLEGVEKLEKKAK